VSFCYPKMSRENAWY